MNPRFCGYLKGHTIVYWFTQGKMKTGPAVIVLKLGAPFSLHPKKGNLLSPLGCSRTWIETQNRKKVSGVYTCGQTTTLCQSYHLKDGRNYLKIHWGLAWWLSPVISHPRTKQAWPHAVSAIRWIQNPLAIGMPAIATVWKQRQGDHCNMEGNLVFTEGHYTRSYQKKKKKQI